MDICVWTYVFYFFWIYTLKWNCWISVKLMFNIFGIARLFSKVATPFYTPTSSIWRLHFSHILMARVSLIIVIFVGVNWCLIVVLICISIWLTILSIFSYVYWLFAYLLWRTVCSDLLPIFKLPKGLPGEGNGTPLQYSCLENPMDGGAW